MDFAMVMVLPFLAALTGWLGGRFQRGGFISVGTAVSWVLWFAYGFFFYALFRVMGEDMGFKWKECALYCGFILLFASPALTGQFYLLKIWPLKKERRPSALKMTMLSIGVIWLACLIVETVALIDEAAFGQEVERQRQLSPRPHEYFRNRWWPMSDGTLCADMVTGRRWALD